MDEYFNEIYDETYSPTLKYVITKCSEMSYVEDIMQNIYLNLYNTILKKGKYINDYSSFVFILAKRELFKYYSLKSKFRVLFSSTDFAILENTVLEKSCVEVDFINKYNKEAIWDTIKSESLETQKIMVLHYMEGVNIKEIGKLLDINENTVKTKIYRTISKLKGILGDLNEWI